MSGPGASKDASAPGARLHVYDAVPRGNSKPSSSPQVAASKTSAGALEYIVRPRGSRQFVARRGGRSHVEGSRHTRNTEGVLQ
jgi:hypothetical protein